MKFPLSLLKRFLITDASLEQIGATLTAIGLEVESIEDKATALQAFVVAEIVEATRHPNAEKLQVCNVKSTNGTLQIVCGAPNARAGIKVALANIGTVIPTNGMEIKKSKIRDVESQGMLCSAAELGIGADGGGIIELPADAPLGASIVDVLGLNDPILDINITANRGDCMGVYGIARDLAAAGLGKLKAPCVPAIAATDACPIQIRIDDADGCPAFLGRVIRGVKNGASPQWLQDVLTKSGMRPISALVDVTNYFTLAFGRPLHVYDLAKVTGTITARRAKDGEALHALNEKDYRLNTQCCVIADDARVLGIGGVMGGSHSGVSDSTTDILLEVALFNPQRIAKTGQTLEIISDARQRFERGVDAGFMELAELRATELILELCGGTPTKPTLAGSIPAAQKTIPFDADAINRLGGTNIPETRMIEILKALGFQRSNSGTEVPQESPLPQRGRGLGEGAYPQGTAHVESPSPNLSPRGGEEYAGSQSLKPCNDLFLVPTWRHDISQPADLAEEVLRIVGYDAIPAVSLPKPAQPVASALNPTQARLATIRRTLAARGLHETYGWGFCSEKQAAQFGGQSEALHLLNPISAELSVMRPSLLPHLLSAVAGNASRGKKHLALFEQGAVFQSPPPIGGRSGGGLPHPETSDIRAPHLTSPRWGEELQRTVAAGLRCGLRDGTSHWQAAMQANLFDVKADVGAVIALAGLDIVKVQITPLGSSSYPARSAYHPGRSGAVTLGKTVIAIFGELHPALLKTYDIDFPVMAFEVMLDALPPVKPAKHKAISTSDFQPVTRDFAFVLDKKIPAADLIAAISKAEKNLLQNVTLFDVYEGKNIAADKKSLGISVTLQAPDRTLAQTEIDAVAQAMIAAAAKVGAVLR